MKNMYFYMKILWEFAEKNPEKIKPIHWAIYMVAVERCNRLGWKDKFGMPTDHTMELIGISSRNTYSKAFKELVSFGLIELVQKSTNQSTANVIALPKSGEISPAQNLSKQRYSDDIARGQRLYHNKTIYTYKDDEDTIDQAKLPSSAIEEILFSKTILMDQLKVNLNISMERLQEHIKEFAEFKERHQENTWKNKSDLTKNFEFWLKRKINNLPPNNGQLQTNVCKRKRL